jgi:act minimal PKS chain-length factor (CLF/KS beta)
VNAVITGISVIAPTGLGTDKFWRRTLDGESGIRPISLFDASSYPVQLAGEVSDFDPAAYLPHRLLPQTDRMTQFALSAGAWALEDAAIDMASVDPLAMGVVTANSSGGFEFGQRELQNLWGYGPQYVSAYQSFAWFYAVNTGQLSIRHGLRGPSGVLVSEQAGALDALGHARRHIRKGLRMVVSGGFESSLCPWGLSAQLTSGRLARSADPANAYRPFATDADGHVIGEGGALLVVESAAVAAERRAPRIYGRISGYCSTFDPSAGSGRPGRLEGAIRGALEDAETSPSGIDAVFADAAGIPLLDSAEADALTAVFGPRAVAVTAPKTMPGRLSSGGAAVDVAASLLAMRDGIIPPTVNVDQPDPRYQLDLVTEPRERPLTNCLVVARGYGGFNSAMVLSAAR